MNKKKLLFIIPILLLVGIGTAVLVDYYGKLTTDVAVESPITFDEDLYDLGSEEVLNDGHNHYLLIKGENHLDMEVPVIPVITILKDGEPITDATGLHLAIDAGGDMHYCYDPLGDMTDVGNCDTDYIQYLTNNPDWFDWLGTDSTYELSGFVSPVINHGGDSWIDGSSLFNEGVLTLPETGVDPGLFVALLVVRGDLSLDPGNYRIEVEFRPI